MKLVFHTCIFPAKLNEIFGMCKLSVVFSFILTFAKDKKKIIEIAKITTLQFKRR